jgi:hypothetical protein
VKRIQIEATDGFVRWEGWMQGISQKTCLILNNGFRD